MKTHYMKIAWAFARAWASEEGASPRLFISNVCKALARRPAGMACLQNPTAEEKKWLVGLARVGWGCEMGDMEYEYWRGLAGALVNNEEDGYNVPVGRTKEVLAVVQAMAEQIYSC